MKPTIDMIAVMTAFQAGERIETKRISSNTDTDWNLTANPVWNWGRYDYRVKPEVTYEIGSRWINRTHGYGCGEIYILAQTSADTVSLIDLKSGNRYSDDGLIIESKYQQGVGARVITEQEFQVLSAGEKWEKVFTK